MTSYRHRHCMTNSSACTVSGNCEPKFAKTSCEIDNNFIDIVTSSEKKAACTNPDHLSKILSSHVIVCLDEDLSELALPNRIVLGVELVKPVERVAVLRSTVNQHRNYTREHIFFM